MIEIIVSQAKFDELRRLVAIMHKHYDGMNECPVCDTPIIDAAIHRIKELKAALVCAQKPLQMIANIDDQNRAGWALVAIDKALHPRK
jgi:hypothetical protein